MNYFYSHCINHLSNNQKLDIHVHVHVFIRFNVGRAAQYISKGPFLDVIQSDIPTEDHLFGSLHGKGSSDGDSAVIKQLYKVAGH